MSDKIKWGILGTGAIAKQFAQVLQTLDDAELLAVGSRTQESADNFGNQYNIKRRYPCYETLAADPDIDVVYISTPHSLHKSNTLLCLENKKAVLCEKPFAINTHETMEMIQLAKQNDLFLMEAMWMYFFPTMIKIKELINNNVIGKIHLVNSKFCFKVDKNPESRLFNPNLGGGTLLDFGIYNIAFAYLIFGRAPDSIISAAHIGKTNVDEQASLIFNYNNEAFAELTSSFKINLPCNGGIFGSDGWINIPHRFWESDVIQLKQGDNPVQEIKFEHLENCYSYEALEVMHCLKNGKKQSEIMPHKTTIEIMKIMDKIREQWGLKYPME